MTDLKPLFAMGEPPLSIASGRRPRVDGSIRPLLRGLILMMALGLPILGSLAISIVTKTNGAHPDVVRHARLSGSAQ